MEDSPAERRAKRIGLRWERQGAKAIPAMVRAICTPDINENTSRLASVAEEALVRFPSQASPVLWRASRNEFPRCSAGHAYPSTILANIYCSYDANEVEESSRKRLEHLTNELTHTNRQRRRTSLAILSKALESSHDVCKNKHSVVEAALPVLLSMLSSNTPGDKKLALQLIGFAGRKAGPAGAKLVTAIVPLLDDKFRVPDAIVALGKLGPQAAETVPYLRTLLKSESDELRSKAIVALGGIGPASRATLGDLVEPLKRDLFRLPTTRAIGEIGSATKEIVQLLRAQIKQQHASGPCTEAPTPCNESELMYASVTSIGQLGAIARPAKPELYAIVVDESLSRNLRTSAAKALRKTEVALTKSENSKVALVLKQENAPRSPTQQVVTH